MPAIVSLHKLNYPSFRRWIYPLARGSEPVGLLEILTSLMLVYDNIKYSDI